MSEMVERVARALWEDRNPGTDWGDDAMRDYFGHARAAIEAVQEDFAQIAEYQHSSIPDKDDGSAHWVIDRIARNIRSALEDSDTQAEIERLAKQPV